MGESKIQIGQWSQPTSSFRQSSRANDKTYSRVGGIAGTLIVHALVLQTTLLGTHRQLHRTPDAQGAGAIHKQSDVSAEDPLILLDLPTVNMSKDSLDDDVASAGAAARNTLVTVFSNDPLPFVNIPDVTDDEKGVEAAIDSGDSAGRALMYGRYTGQIDARIERVWRRPRTPINGDRDPELANHVGDRNETVPPDESFKCQVRILQNNRGAIQEVQLIRCNGSAAWQHSLVAAILASSPLPAPPTPKVFTSALTMTFEGHPYSPQSSSEDYEIAARAN